MNNCPLFETCSKLRKEAKEKFEEKKIWSGDMSTCYNPSWLLNNHKKCENYHPDLKQPQTEKKTVKKEKTEEDFRKEAKKQIAKETTPVEIIERCMKSGITDYSKILAELVKMFPDIKESRLKGRIKGTIKYLKEKGRI
ncbi:MAG: hypothetical protein ACFFAU_01220 [Candidatus Hodarchaeota archaeon]